MHTNNRQKLLILGLLLSFFYITEKSVYVNDVHTYKKQSKIEPNWSLTTNHLQYIKNISGRFVFSPNSSTTKIFCGGVFISKYNIITAAHCLENLTSQQLSNSYFELPESINPTSNQTNYTFKIQSFEISKVYLFASKAIKKIPALYYLLDSFYKKYDVAIVTVKEENIYWKQSFLLANNKDHVIDNFSTRRNNIFAYTYDIDTPKSSTGEINNCLAINTNNNSVVESYCQKPLLKGNSGSPIFEITRSGLQLIAITIGKISEIGGARYVFVRSNTL